MTETARDTLADPRWLAVVARDRQANGQFVYSVSSTGVFCRPSCPSRRPRPENVRFHGSAAAAAQAGFRPCKRCKPELSVKPEAPDLFTPPAPAREVLGPGALLLRRFATGQTRELLEAVAEVAAQAPFRHMVTPRGFRMSVAMTNCGTAGWITDRRGYRYEGTDHETGRAWPALPPVFLDLATKAASAAGYPGFRPDAALINRYEAGTRLSLHRDENERDAAAPIVSVSLGLPATFLFGGLARTDRPRRLRLEHGDVVVWGGPLRFAYHGIAPLKPGEHALTGPCRYNITLRRAL